MDATRQLSEVYALASAGDAEAFAWLVAFHGWAHAIDDHVDEKDHLAAEVVDLCANGVVLCASGFFAQHAKTLGPLLAVVAEQYKASLKEANTPLHDCLRIAGNQVVLMVAYLKGGRPLLEQVSQKLWPLVLATQLEK